MKKKYLLQELKIKSFVTDLKINGKGHARIKGGEHCEPTVLCPTALLERAHQALSRSALILRAWRQVPGPSRYVQSCSPPLLKRGQNQPTPQYTPGSIQ